MQTRRNFIKSTGALALAAAVTPALGRPARDDVTTHIESAGDFVALEAASRGRLGVCLWHPVRGQVVGYREQEDFPTASTIKFPLCAAVLAKADAGEFSLDLRIPVREQDMRPGAPVSGRHVGKDITVRDLCRGSMVWSDNPAVGLLLRLVGGEAGFQQFLREHGDADTRYNFDGGGTLDGTTTTSPRAMARNLKRFVLDETLSEPSRLQLADWLIENRTGDQRIRAGMPEGWRVGDKTGGMDGVSNDIAVLWPLAGGSPWLLAIYLRDSALEGAQRNDVLRRATQLVVERLRA
jgi:beta-lactamase class A